MSNDPPRAGRECFVLLPLGEPGSPRRRSARGLLEAVLHPVLDDLGFTVELASELGPPETITLETIRRLMDADLVVADLTGLNPAVLYGLAVRDSAAEPAVLLVEENTRMPFGFSDERVVEFRDDMLGVKELRRVVPGAVRRVMEAEATGPVLQVAREKITRELLGRGADEPARGTPDPAGEDGGSENLASEPGNDGPQPRGSNAGAGIPMEVVGDASAVLGYRDRIEGLVGGPVTVTRLGTDGGRPGRSGPSASGARTWPGFVRWATRWPATLGSTASRCEVSTGQWRTHLFGARARSRLPAAPSGQGAGFSISFLAKTSSRA